MCVRSFLEDNVRPCKGRYQKVREVYKIAGKRIPNLLLHKCDKCGHTTLPWESVLRVDKATTKERKQHAKERLRNKHVNKDI
jgi:uncharacterized OB-fold protein